ncbi:MAG TPA: hypothetical protein VEH04_04775 [Verrucomicrobiae bacterium]|nr:hypothetical protein [Verrucomicrobiae bacterium]
MNAARLYFILSSRGTRARVTKALSGSFVLLFALFASAQNSTFVFDANGNLHIQAAATLAPPQIIAQPQNRIAAPGESASFSVVAADARSLAYQWRFSGTNLVNANKDTLLLSSVNANSQGEFRVVLTNPSGSVTSAPAFLIIDSDADGLGDSWETTQFGGLSQVAAGDFDGDGASNLQEFQDGSNPGNSNSVHYRLLVIRDGGSVIKALDKISYTNGESVTLTAVASAGQEPFHSWMGDILTRSNPVTLVMTNNKTVIARFTPIVLTWTNLAGGDWNVAVNWSPNLTPGSNDTVIIPAGSATLNTSADCADVILSSGSLAGSGTLTVSGTFAWLGGGMNGTGRTVIKPGAILEIASGSASLNARVLENAGTVRITGAGVFSVVGGAVITNRAGALFEIQNAVSIGSGFANGRLDNAGTFRKSINSGAATFDGGMSLNNWGAVEIQAGTINLGGGGSSSSTFMVPAASALNWTGGTFIANPGAQFLGQGRYGNNFGTLTANTNLTIDNLDMVNGTLNGSGTVSIATEMNWTGGTMSGSGRTFIAAGATVNLSNPSGVGLNTRTLENAGSIVWTGQGPIGMNFDAVITNRPGGLFHVRTDASLSSGAGGNRFDNAGIFRKSMSSGTTVLSSIFNNLGVVELQSGTLQCNGFFTNNGTLNLSLGTTNRIAGGGASSGIFSTPATALVEWVGGTFTLNPGAQLNGMGLYRLNGISTIVVGNENLTVQNLDIVNQSSTWSGTGIMTIGNAMKWSGGSMDGTGRTLIAPGATLHLGSNDNITLKRTLENAGSAFWDGASSFILLNGAITNRAGALFQAQNSAPIFYAGGSCRFDNAGTFRKASGIGTTTIPGGVPFNNSGVVDIRSGVLAVNGGYVSSTNALLNCGLGGTTAGTNHGQLQVAGAVALNGAFSVDLIPGFVPATNDTFTVIVAGSRNGTFSSFLYPSNLVSMQLSNSPGSVVVRVLDVLAPLSLPYLFTPGRIGSNWKLSWTAVSNASYRLEYNPEFGSSNWAALPGDVTALSNTASKLDISTPSNRLYRVRVLP